MTENPMCAAVSGSGSPCALLQDHARPSTDYPHVTIEGHQFEQQVKPAIEEPTKFGSAVRAWFSEPGHADIWLNVGYGYWSNRFRTTDIQWSDLTVLEVLRTGVGEASDGAALPVRRDGEPLAAAPSPRFCTLYPNCRLADGHVGQCKP